MKKIIALMIAVITAFSLVACSGGADKQPAIDAFNQVNTAFNEVVAVINANPDDYTEDVINSFTQIAGVLATHKATLEGKEKLTEEALNEMIAWYGDVEEWIANTKTELGIE